MPPVVAVVKVTVAIPLLFVVLVAAEKVPLEGDLVHVTVLPDVASAVLLSKLSCAVMVTSAPAVGLEELDVTTYIFAATGAERIARAIITAPARK